jgi:SnoaL-like protein
MGQADVELVSKVQGLLTEDLKPALDDATLVEALQEFVDPGAEVSFIGPEDGPLGNRLVPERGVEGLREGWRDWMEPWEQFWIRFRDVLDAGEGKVLSLGELCGRLQGGAEVTQPGAAYFRIRDGRIVAIDFYVDQDQARRDAGLVS